MQGFNILDFPPTPSFLIFVLPTQTDTLVFWTIGIQESYSPLVLRLRDRLIPVFSDLRQHTVVELLHILQHSLRLDESTVDHQYG